MAPQVEDLSAIIARLNAQYDPLRQSAQQQIGQAQTIASQGEAGINAQKTDAFNGIQQAANQRGMLFSGFTPDQQAKYVSSTYLPALVNLHAKTQDNITKLQQNILSLNQQQNQQAEDIRGGQVKSLNDYNINQQKLAQELAIAQMNNQARLQAAQISAGPGYARAAASSAKAPTAAQIKQQDTSTVQQLLNSKKGKDNHVSQETWNEALNAWTNAGYDATDFVKQNIRFINQRYKGYSGFN